MHSAQPAERQRELDPWHMRRALALAEQGQGCVEPNPMVGCVIARGAEIIGEGWHARYGGPHAEVVALEIAGARAAGAIMYVTLEPCCHHGKTPPCTNAILAAGVREVVVAEQDPFPRVAGGGIASLRAAGVRVDVGILEAEARRLNAPYRKLQTEQRPWVIAKWAMTLDGKLATATGVSRWISGEASRQIVHQLRGRVDAILIGRGTAAADDPLLIARPAGSRVAARVVVDTRASLSVNSQLVRTARQYPVIVAAAADAPEENVDRLSIAGCEVLQFAGVDHVARLNALLAELGKRQMTNVLVEGGSELFGALADAGQIDEAHAFIAPKYVGGAAAMSPLGGAGIEDMAQAWRLTSPTIEIVDGDVYVHGHVNR
jgi:diaminohydroxyphosphoribosylaminopyrimidine deaminase/5-amino-6-(5-phosphoribosylamino)uracil reductase